MITEQNASILVVDDDPELTRLLELILRRANFKTSIANSGQDGLRMAAEELPDLVILDIMMPDIDGIEVCYRLRKDPVTAEIPIMILTTANDIEMRGVALEAGADVYVVKPISPKQLVEKIHQLLASPS